MNPSLGSEDFETTKTWYAKPADLEYHWIVKKNLFDPAWSKTHPGSVIELFRGTLNSEYREKGPARRSPLEASKTAQAELTAWSANCCPPLSLPPTQRARSGGSVSLPLTAALSEALRPKTSARRPGICCCCFGLGLEEEGEGEGAAAAAAEGAPAPAVAVASPLLSPLSSEELPLGRARPLAPPPPFFKTSEEEPDAFLGSQGPWGPETTERPATGLLPPF